VRSVANLDEATTTCKNAPSLDPVGRLDHSASLDNIGVTVDTQQSGSMEDLEVEVTYLREALDLCPPGHPDRSMFLNNLANVVYTLYVQSDRTEDLEEAITLERPSGRT
jgi:hypothetical protein